MTLNHINILKKTYLLAMLLLLSVGAMADNNLTPPASTIKATVSQTLSDKVNLEEAFLDTRDVEGFTCSFADDGTFVMTKGTNQNTLKIHIAELPMKYGSAMDIEFSTTTTQNVTNSTANMRKVTFTTDGYATIYSAFQINLGSIDQQNLSFYAPKLNNDKTKLLLNDDTKIVGGIIPPKTALVVYKPGTNQSGTSVNFQYTVATTGLTSKQNNDLNGCLIAEPVDNYKEKYTMYTLDYWENPAPSVQSYSAFFEFVGDEGNPKGETPVIKGNTHACRALLLIEKGGQSAKKIVPFSDDPTGIDDIQMDNNIKEGPRYNLSGQRVNRNAKGIIIVGGKKYINI